MSPVGLTSEPLGVTVLATDPLDEDDPHAAAPVARATAPARARARERMGPPRLGRWDIGPGTVGGPGHGEVPPRSTPGQTSRPTWPGPRGSVRSADERTRQPRGRGRR